MFTENSVYAALLEIRKLLLNNQKEILDRLQRTEDIQYDLIKKLVAEEVENFNNNLEISSLKTSHNQAAAHAAALVETLESLVNEIDSFANKQELNPLVSSDLLEIISKYERRILDSNIGNRFLNRLHELENKICAFKDEIQTVEAKLRLIEDTINANIDQESMKKQIESVLKCFV